MFMAVAGVRSCLGGISEILFSQNTGAPSVNHRIYGEAAFQIVERRGVSVYFGTHDGAVLGRMKRAGN